MDWHKGCVDRLVAGPLGPSPLYFLGRSPLTTMGGISIGL